MRTALEKTLLERGLSEGALDAANAGAKLVDASPTGYLVECGLVTEAELTAALAHTFRLPAWDGTVDAEAARAIGAIPLRTEIVIPVTQHGGRLVLAVADPTHHHAHAALAAATKARHVDVVVGAGPAIMRALNTLFPFEWADDLLPLLADYKGSERADWEEKLHARWDSDAAHDAVEVRLANYLLLSIMSEVAREIRIELTDTPRVVSRTDGTWALHPMLDGVKLGRGLLRDVGARLVRMTTTKTLRAEAWGSVTVYAGRSLGTSRSIAVDIVTAEVPRGRMVHVERAGRRFRNDDGNAIFTLFDNAEHALASLRFASARELADRAIAASEKLEPGTLELELGLALRARILACEGRLDESGAIYRRILDRPRTGGGTMSSLHNLIALADDELDAGRFAACEATCERALELADDLFGAPTMMSSSALSLLGLARLHRGAIADAESTLARLRAETREFPSAHYHASFLGLHVAVTSGAFAEADALATTAIAEIIEGCGPERPIHGLALRLHARAARGLGDFSRAATLLDRASANLRACFGPSHPILVETDRELLESRAKHPYR